MWWHLSYTILLAASPGVRRVVTCLYCVYCTLLGYTPHANFPFLHCKLGRVRTLCYPLAAVEFCASPQVIRSAMTIANRHITAWDSSVHCRCAGGTTRTVTTARNTGSCSSDVGSRRTSSGCTLPARQPANEANKWAALLPTGNTSWVFCCHLLCPDRQSTLQPPRSAVSCIPITDVAHWGWLLCEKLLADRLCVTSAGVPIHWVRGKINWQQQAS